MLQRRIIGRIPIYFGEYNPSYPYLEKNRMTYYGSEFQAAVDNPTRPPFKYDGRTVISEWNLRNGEHADPNGEWYIISAGSLISDVGARIDNIVIFDTEIDLDIERDNVSSTTVYKNQQEAITLHGVISTPEPKEIARYKLFIDNVEVQTKDSSSLTYDYQDDFSISDPRKYTLEVMVNGLTKSNSITVYPVDKIYYGSSISYTECITAEPKIEHIGSYSIRLVTNGQRFYFYIPKEIYNGEILNAKINGFPAPFKYEEISISGIQYRKWMSTNTYRAGDYTIVLE